MIACSFMTGHAVQPASLRLPVGLSIPPGGPGGNPMDWLGWLGGAFLGFNPTPQEWASVWYEARMVSRSAYDLLSSVGWHLHLMGGVPITDHPAIRHLAKQLVGYPGDATTTFAMIAGLEMEKGCFVSVDKLYRHQHGSVAVVPHEVRHALCRHLHPFPYDHDFQDIWQSQSWGHPVLDASAWECWAETGAWADALLALGMDYDGNYSERMFRYHVDVRRKYGLGGWPEGL